MSKRNFDFVSTKFHCQKCKGKLHIFCKPIKEENISFYCYNCVKNNELKDFFPGLFDKYKNLKLITSISMLKEKAKVKSKLIIIDLASLKMETVDILSKKENVFYMQFFPEAPYTRRSMLNDGGMYHSTFEKNILSMTEIYLYQDGE